MSGRKRRGERGECSGMNRVQHLNWLLELIWCEGGDGEGCGCDGGRV